MRFHHGGEHQGWRPSVYIASALSTIPAHVPAPSSGAGGEDLWALTQMLNSGSRGPWRELRFFPDSSDDQVAAAPLLLCGVFFFPESWVETASPVGCAWDIRMCIPELGNSAVCASGSRSLSKEPPGSTRVSRHPSPWPWRHCQPLSGVGDPGPSAQLERSVTCASAALRQSGLDWPAASTATFLSAFYLVGLQLWAVSQGWFLGGPGTLWVSHGLLQPSPLGVEFGLPRPHAVGRGSFLSQGTKTRTWPSWWPL